MVRERGFATENQENEIGVSCLAVPIWLTSPRPSQLGAISVSGLTYRTPLETLAEAAGKIASIVTSKTGSALAVATHPRAHRGPSPVRPCSRPSPLIGESLEAQRVGPVRTGNARAVPLVDPHHYVDVSDVVDDFNERDFGTGGRCCKCRQSPRAPAGGPGQGSSSGDGLRIRAPIARPHQILCIGLNYSDHAAETGQAVP